MRKCTIFKLKNIINYNGNKILPIKYKIMYKKIPNYCKFVLLKQMIYYECFNALQ